jgi:ParB family transcriptional regulator, chromosome partitioning protein
MTKDPITVEISAIRVPERLRPVDPAAVEMLAASFLERGQDTRIIIRADGGSDRYVLIAGAHRLAAAKQMGWIEIDAELIDVSDDEARIIEIDENLVRRELSVLDRAVFLLERKLVWERLHPETAHGKARKSRQNKVANLATFQRFSKDAAARTGLSERTIRRASLLSEKLSLEVRDLLRLSRIADNQSQLFALAKMDDEAQRAIAIALATGQASSLAKAIEIAGLSPRRNINPDEALFQKFLNLWARSNRALRNRILVYSASEDAANVPVSGEDEAD